MRSVIGYVNTGFGPNVPQSNAIEKNPSLFGGLRTRRFGKLIAVLSRLYSAIAAHFLSRIGGKPRKDKNGDQRYYAHDQECRDEGGGIRR